MVAEPGNYSDYTGLKLEKSDGIMTITLSNPGKRNALTRNQSEELARIWDDVWRDPEVGVIILSGEGDDFCTGADISEIGGGKGAPTPSKQPVNRISRVAKKHVLGIIDCEKPVIAKVRGHAIGVGASMALACDLVFASSTAHFRDSHVPLGMAAGDGGVLLWPMLIGLHRAKEYLLTGKPVKGEDAAAMGLINACVPDEELDARVQQMAETLRDLPPHAVAYTKSSLNAALRQATGSAFEASLAYELYTMNTNDHREAIKAFVERRPGDYKGD